MAGKRMADWAALDAASVSGFDNAAQFVAFGLGMGGEAFQADNVEIKKKFTEFLSKAGDGILPHEVKARAGQLFDVHTAMHQLQKAGTPVSKNTLQQFYSLIHHLLPENEEGKPYKKAIETFFEKLEIGEPGKRVLSKDEVQEGIEDMFGISPSRGGQGRA